MSTQIVTTESVELYATKAPALPYAPNEYSKEYHNQLNNVLRLYFNNIDSFLANLKASSETSGLFLPYGAFQDSTTQTATTTTSAYVVTFNTTDQSNGVTLVSGSRLTVEYSGLYNIQFSAQFDNSTNAPQDIDVWFRKNGTDIPSSNSRFGLAARKTVSDPFHTVGTINLFVNLQANDYVELAWCTTNVGASIKSYVAGTSPTRPAVPSVIATVNFISAV